MSGPEGDNVASGSTSHDVSEVHREIEALFRWNPPTLILPPKKSTIKIRPPAFYDLHFEDRLILRRVTRLPSLVQTLATNVDDMLSAALKTLPSKPPPILSVELRDEVFTIMDVLAPDEKAVATYYDKTTALYCLPLASALLRPMDGFFPILKWRQPGSGGHAIMDGQLEIRDEKGVGEPKKARFQEILASMDPEARHKYEKLKRSPLATWKFKSLTTGCDAVMDAVRKLDKFSWTYSEDPKCQKLDKYQKLVEKIAMIKVGPDARKTPWDFKVSSFTSNLADDCSLFRECSF
jgi:hypothetical protein